jgi:putative ABC transport system permease protein
VTAALILLASLVAGIVPAAGRRSDLGAVMRSSRRTSSGGRQLARSALVIGEVALALMLLVGCGLLGRSVMGLLSIDPGFTVERLLTLEVNSVGQAYQEDGPVFTYHDRVREVVAALPGVESVAIASQIPLGGNMDQYGIIPLDRLLDNPEKSPSAERYAVSPGYLKTMGIAMTSGREFSLQETTDTTNRAVIISDELARAVWPGESPLGKLVRVGGAKSLARRVIGTVRSVRHSGLDETTALQVYLPERQWGGENQVTLVVRTAGDPEAIVSSVRRVIREIDPTQPIVRVATMDQLIASSTAQRRLALVLFAVFAGTALILAVAGIYGVLAGRVAERTREIGVRSALGAAPRDILALVVGQGLRLAIVGLVLGLLGAFGLSQFLQSMLFGIAPNDPATLASVAGVLGAVTVVACVIPAMRALRVQPTEALRSE